MGEMFFDGWQSLLRTLVIGVLAYVALVVILRVSGNRTLSKLNAFDFIVTVALGSTLATVLLSKDVSLAEGVFALSLLVALQYAVTWTSVRASWVRRLMTGEPLMLLYQGELLHKALRQARVTEDEVRAALRSAGVRDLKDAQAVVLETDASFSVLREGGAGAVSSLADVKCKPDAGGDRS